METYVLFALYALGVAVLVGLLFRQLRNQHDQRTIQERWAERERLLDRARPHATRREILERRSGPVETRGLAPQQSLQIVEPEPVARVLFIVARDQRDLARFLHEDFAAEEAEGLIEIVTDRRQSLEWPSTQPQEARGRRDPERNRVVAANLRETGCALVRQPTRLPGTALDRTHLLDPVALGR